MRKVSILVAIICLVATSSVNASVLFNLLTGPAEGLDFITDDSRAVVFDADGGEAANGETFTFEEFVTPGNAEVGDVLTGFFNFTQVTPAGGAAIDLGVENITLIALFSAEVTSISGAGGLTFGATAAASPFALSAFADDLFGAAAADPDIAAGAADDIIFIIGSAAGVSTATSDADAAADPLTFLGSLDDSLSFEAAGGIVATTDFFFAQPGGSRNELDESGALSFVATNLDDPAPFVPVATFNPDGVPVTADITFSGTVGGIVEGIPASDAPPAGSPFAFGNQATFVTSINVPEPTTLLVWSFLGLAAGTIVQRRTRA